MKTKLFKKLGILFGSFAMVLGAGISLFGNEKANETNADKLLTSTFNSKAWGVVSGGETWVSDNDAYQYSNPNVQITAGASGAGATSTKSYTNIKEISITALTTSKGVGNITVSVGDAAAQTICSLSKNTTATSYKLTYATPVTGKISFIVNCSTNSMYVRSISITTAETKTLSSIAVTTNPTKTTYYVGDELDTTGLVVTATYSDSSTGDVTSDCTFSPATLNIAGTQTITVTHTASMKTTTFDVTVNAARTISSISVSGNLTKTSFSTNDSWNFAGLVVTGTYSDSSTSDVTSNSTFAMYDKSSNLISSPASLTVQENLKLDCIATCQGKNSAKYEVTVTITEKTYTSGIKDGARYIIEATYRPNESSKVGPFVLPCGQYTSAPSGTSGSGSTFQHDSAKAWTFTSTGEDDQWYIHYYDETEKKEMYLYNTATNNGVRSNTSATAHDNGWKFNASLVGSTKLVINLQDSKNSRYLTAYNTPDFRCYTSSTAQGDGSATITLTEYSAPITYDSLTLSANSETKTFGTKFTCGLTATAHYSNGTTSVVTPTSFNLNTASGTALTNDTTLTFADHDKKTVVVLYTENSVTHTASYTLNIQYASISELLLSSYVASVGTGQLFDHNDVVVTINPQNADQNYTWTVNSNTVNDDFVFDNDGLLAGDTPGTVTLRCSSTADSTKYKDLVVTITGEPVVHLVSDSITGYATKTVSAAVKDTQNMGAITSYLWTINSGSEFISIKDSATSSTVEINCLSAGVGVARVTVSDGTKSAFADATITVNAYTVTKVEWSATNINTFTGDQLTSAIDDDWMVNYTMNNGDSDYIVYGDYKVLLGNDEISLPYTWSINDNNKDLCVEYGGVKSTSVIVTVNQKLNQVIKEEYSVVSSNLAFSAKCGGSGVTDDSVDWIISSDASESDFDSNRGIHYGTSKILIQYLNLSSDGYSARQFNKIKVNASVASDVTATLKVLVNGIQYGDTKNLTNTATEYTINGALTQGSIQVVISKEESSKGALYCKSVKVISETKTGESNIANDVAYASAQNAVVSFAQSFNEIMSSENVCSGTKENLSTAWAEAKEAYQTFLTAISSLSSEQQQRAKDLLAWSNGLWTAGTDDNQQYCLERAMGTYDYCVANYGLEAFINDVRSSDSQVTNKKLLLIEVFDSTWIIVAVSLTGLTAIGGYFFYKKRKENI